MTWPADVSEWWASCVKRGHERKVAAECIAYEDLAAARKDADWDGTERRCEHIMKWISDWYGDPSIPYGTQDCSRLECENCGWIDPNGEKQERDWDYERDKRMDDARDAALGSK